MRGTGGSSFIDSNSDAGDLLQAIRRGVDDLSAWASQTGRTFDPGAITVETRRVADGRICVSVTGDLVKRAEVTP